MKTLAVIVATAGTLSLAACGGGSSDDTAASIVDSTVESANASATAGSDTMASETMASDTMSADTMASDTMSADTMASAPAEGGGDPQAVAGTISQQLLNAPGSQLSEEESQCWADKIVSDLGVDRLAEIGVTAESAAPLGQIASAGLTETEGTQVAAGLFNCVDVKAAMIKTLESTGQMDATMAQCVVDNIDEKVLEQFLSVSITGAQPDPEVLAKLGEAGTGCVGG